MKNLTIYSKKIVLSLLLLIGLALHLSSQNQRLDNSSSFWQNVRFGGGLGLSFGNGFFSGSLAPSAIYEFNPYVAAGIGLNVTYSEQNNVFNSTVLGGSIIGLYNPIQDIQLSTEFEQLYVNRNFDENFISNIDDKYWYPALFLGVGYRTGSVTVGIRYDVLYDEDKSIYADPWMPFFRVFF